MKLLLFGAEPQPDTDGVSGGGPHPNPDFVHYSRTRQAGEMIDTATSRPCHGLQNAASFVSVDCLQADLVYLAHGTKTRHKVHWDFGPISLVGAEVGISVCRHAAETNKHAS